MSSSQYRVFVCTKQRHPNDPEGCCRQCGALEIYAALQTEIQRRQLEHQVDLRQSGCLDRCEAGAVVLVYQPNRNDFSWLPTKLRLKWRQLLVPNRHLYGHLTAADIPELVERHLVGGQPLNHHRIEPL